MTRALSIGLLSHAWFPDRGGVESHTRDLARELLALGHRVHAIALDTSGVNEPFSVHDTEESGVPVRRMAYAYHDHAGLENVARNANAEDVALAWAREHSFDLVHVHHTTGWGLGVLRALSEAGFPVVMTLHDYWPLCPRGQMLRVDGVVCEEPEAQACADCLGSTWPHLFPDGAHAEVTGARTAYALDALSSPARLLTPSEAAKSVYVRAGVPAGRIEVCENGIEVSGLAEKVERLRNERGPREGKSLGFLGSVLPSKGPLELARAFVDADLPGWTLEIHGSLPPYHGDASYVEAVQALAAANEKIHVHGPYDLLDLPRILAGLDVVAAPSLWCEVYGLTVREARAAGLRLLVSDAGDLFCVTRGGAGTVVPAGDHTAWVEAIRALAHESAPRPRPLEGLRDAATMTVQIERAYRESLRKKPGFWRRLFGRD